MTQLKMRYEEYRQILKAHTGIELGAGKATLLESRLNRRLTLVNAKDFDEYLNIIKKDEGERKVFLEVMTTNKTDWFRESYHFDFLAKIAKDSIQRPGGQPLMIWCAAASTGEEPYSLAMTCNEVLQRKAEYRILATDINTKVLNQAESGVYAKTYLEANLDGRKIKSYFTANKDQTYKVSPLIQQNIKFRFFNLINSELPREVKFDCIFLRNVLIYFDSPTIKRVIDRISRNLTPGGYLVIGHSETLNGISSNLKHLGKSVYFYEPK